MPGLRETSAFDFVGFPLARVEPIRQNRSGIVADLAIIRIKTANAIRLWIPRILTLVESVAFHHPRVTPITHRRNTTGDRNGRPRTEIW
jgi:hypothetical protein